MAEITFDQIEAKVRELAAESPEYRYPGNGNGSCFYAPNGEIPSCIFGKALIALGVEASWLTGREGNGIVALMRDHLSVAATVQQRLWAARLQRFQDTGQTWGYAVSEADRLFPLR